MANDEGNQVAIAALATLLSLGCLFLGFLLLTGAAPFLDFALAELLSIPFFLITVWIWFDFATHGLKMHRTRDERRQAAFRDDLRARREARQRQFEGIQRWRSR